MIRDEETGWVEAHVVINGYRLNFAEAMTLRVAVSSFRMSVSNEETARLLGEPLAKNYEAALASIELKMREAK